MKARKMLEQVLAEQSGPFALLHRPTSVAEGQLEILFGEISTVNQLADVPLAENPGEAGHQALVLVPHRQIVERGFTAAEDGSALLVLTVTEQGQIANSELFKLLPDEPVALTDEGFDIKDDAYANIVRAVLEDEIGNGEGSNFVINRSFVANITNYSLSSALSLFRRLLIAEAGAYWTFLVHTGDRTFVGATPERHISLQGGVAVMNPISGTYRYPPSGPVLAEILDFLDDHKETDELYMVLDEELKMMARICDGGGQVIGPFMREMSKLAHTEYYIQGHSDLDPRDILRETLLAPTVIGSPLENACRVIARHEPQGRGYYGGVAALIGREPDGAQTIDSAILIRTADIQGSISDKLGHLKIGVGATLVRHSRASAEVAETHTKAAGILSALTPPGKAQSACKNENSGVLSAADYSKIRDALLRRNSTISSFWLTDVSLRTEPKPLLSGRRVLIIDAEDTFIAMIAHQLRAIGLTVVVVRFDESYCIDDYDLVVLGPGPGDPRETSHPRMAHMSAAIEYLLFRRIPFLAVCLSHQLLCHRLGLGLVRRELPNQGVQRDINLFGSLKRVGFYNSYVAWSRTDRFSCSSIGDVQVNRDMATGEVHALAGSHFSSVQFHIESVLTQDGVGIFTELLSNLLMTNEVVSP